MQRQPILERLGWTFVRIRVSEYYKNSDKAMKKVFDRLKKLAIAPELNNLDNSIEMIDSKNISNEVVCVAHNILKDWDKGNSRDGNFEKQLVIFSII